MIKKITLGEFLEQLAACFPGTQKLTTQTGREYTASLKDALKNIDLLVLKERLKKRSEFFPTIKLILEEAQAMKAQAREFNGGPTPPENFKPIEPTKLEKLLRDGGFAAVADKLKGDM